MGAPLPPDIEILASEQPQPLNSERSPPDLLEVIDGTAPEHLSRPTVVKRHPIYCLSIRNAVIFGERAAVTPLNRLVTDVRLPNDANVFLSAHQRRFESMEAEQVDGSLTSQSVDNPELRIDGEAVLLSSSEHYNYGAWLTRIVPKMVMLRELGLADRPILVPCLFAWHRELLDLCGISRAQIINHDRRKSYAIDHLILPSQRCPGNFLDQKTLQFYDGLEAQPASTGCAPSDRGLLYTSRISQAKRKPNYRVCQNKDRVIDLMLRLGFEVIETETLSIIEQMRRFRTAKLVVGPSGAAMYNTIFCRPGAFVLSMEPLPIWLHQHANLFATRGLRYAMILGGADPTDPALHKRWRADLPLLERVVNAIFDKL